MDYSTQPKSAIAKLQVMQTRNYTVTITHFGECPRLMPIYKALRLLDNSQHWDDRTLNLLGVLSTGKVLTHGISIYDTLHTVFWKLILIAFTKLGVEGTPIDEDEIIRNARERISTRIKSANMQLLLTRKHKPAERHQTRFL